MFRKCLERVIGKFLRNCCFTHYCLDGYNSGIEDWDCIIFEQCKTHAQLKKIKIFWQHKLKTFYLIDLKEEYLCWHKKVFLVGISFFSGF